MKLLPADLGRRVRFKLLLEPGSKVCVAGTFNNWNPTANPLNDNSGIGHFKAVMRVQPGTHEYKFVVNSAWLVDPKSSGRATNTYGSQNSVLHVPCFKNGLMAWDGTSGEQVSDPHRAGNPPLRKQEGKSRKNNPLKYLENLKQSIRRDRIASCGLGVLFVILIVLVFMGRI
jgi:hypothetical protein